MTTRATAPLALAPREPQPRPATPRPAGRSRTSLAASFGHALHGLVELAALERNMKLHVLAGLAVCLVGCEVRVPMAAQLAVILSTALVLGAEAVNSALEALVDLHTAEYREEARRVKDAAAGAVLVLATGAVAVAGVVVTRSWEGSLPALGQLRDHVPGDCALLAAGGALLARGGRRAAVLAACAGAALLFQLAARSVSTPFAAMSIGLFSLAVAAAWHADRRRTAP